jgi:hypothetical protein
VNFIYGKKVNVKKNRNFRVRVENKQLHNHCQKVKLTMSMRIKIMLLIFNPDSKITIFFNIYLFTIYKVHPNPILFDIIKFYSTVSVFKII